MADVLQLRLACPTGVGWIAQERRRLEVARGFPPRPDPPASLDEHAAFIMADTIEALSRKRRRRRSLIEGGAA